MSSLVSISESELYFNKLKDQPQLIKHYIEAKSTIEYINKMREIKEILSLYLNTIRVIYDILVKMRELVMSSNGGSDMERTILINSLQSFAQEIDNSVKTMTYKKQALLSKIKVVSRSVDDEIKHNVTLNKESLDVFSFLWEGVCTKKIGSQWFIEYTKTEYLNEDKTTVNTEKGTHILTLSNNSLKCSTNVDITVNLQQIEVLDYILVDTVLEYPFIVGPDGQNYKLFFPRISSGLYKIDKVDIENDSVNDFKNIQDRLTNALNTVNRYIAQTGSEINVIDIKQTNLKNNYNGIMGILNNHLPNV